MTVRTERNDRVTTIVIDRPEARNAVDPPTARRLERAFETFERDPEAHVAVLCGAGGHFSSGADLKALAGADLSPEELLSGDPQDAPMGPTRSLLDKPVIAAIAGYAVAGGLELALWCDLRVMEDDAIVGVFCRRFGVPLVDGGTVRLPRLIGSSRALDLILTGRPVGAAEALSMGLVNRVVAPGEARLAAEALAQQLAELPQTCLRNDRASVYAQAGRPLADALREELRLGARTVASGETLAGARRFAGGAGRHGQRES